MRMCLKPIMYHTLFFFRKSNENVSKAIRFYPLILMKLKHTGVLTHYPIPQVFSVQLLFVSRAVHKKICFLSSGWLKLKPVGQPQLFFTPLFFFMKILSNFRRNFSFFAKMKKKSLQSHLFQPPGRSTGNRIIFMASLVPILRFQYFYMNGTIITDTTFSEGRIEKFSVKKS